VTPEGGRFFPVPTDRSLRGGIGSWESTLTLDQEREVVPLVDQPSGDGVATIVIGECRERLSVLGDEALSPAPDQIAQLLRAHEMEASILQLLNKDGCARPEARRLELARNGNHIAVANAANL